MSEFVLQCENVCKSYHDGDNTIKVLDNITFSLRHGESLAIMGASGSGKSTLLNALGGLDSISDGRILLDGEDISLLDDASLSTLRNQKLGFVYQMHHLLMEFSAVENTAMPLWIRGVGRSEAEAEAREILEKVGLSHRYQHRPSQLSGGERQRVAIARALITKPSCVLMDEPTGNLDEKTSASILGLITELKQKLGLSFVVVTHDRGLASAIGNVMTLSDGKLS